MSQASVFYPLVFGMLGALIGSFLNVVIYRLPREGLKISSPRRSFCPQCNRQLLWTENIPIFSWVFQGGRCRTCKASIPSRYVIVEVLTALLFGYYTVRTLDTNPDLGSVTTYLQMFAGYYLIAVCLAVTYIDIDWKIIPDEITWSGMGLGLLASVAVPALHAESWPNYIWQGDLGWSPYLSAGLSSVAGLATGVLVVLAIGWLGQLAFRKEAMGLGDVKYMGLVGAFLGLDGVLFVFLLGCITGAVGGLVQRAVTGDRYIAFGPYLSLGTLLMLFYRTGIVVFFLVGWPSMVRRMMGVV